MDIIVVASDDRFSESRNLSRIVLPVAGHDDYQIEVVREGVFVSFPDGVTYALSLGVLDDRDWDLASPDRLLDFAGDLVVGVVEDEADLVD